MGFIDKIKSIFAAKKGGGKPARKPLVKMFDRYIIRKFLGTYVFSILLLLAIVVMFDINEKLDAMLTAPLKETIFDYFVNFLPYFANQFSPLFTFIAVIFFTSKLADNSEIIAMLSSGISYRRLVVPYMVSAAVIAVFSFYLAAYVIPPANVERIAYTDNRTKAGHRFSLDKFNDKMLESRMTAERILYDTLYHWTVKNYTIRYFEGLRENIVRGSSLDTIIEIEPRDFLIAANAQEMLTLPELKSYIDRQHSRGVANIKNFEIELERRYASTAAAFILTIIGLSLSSRKVKGGMGVNIGIGLVLSFSYILFTTITSTFAVSGYTSPFVAMWIPNVLYTVIAIYLYRKASI